VSGLAGGNRVNADPATNSLDNQTSKEGFDTISGVIAKLDVERPQVLVEALILEVDVTNSEQLGFTGIFRLINGNTELSTIIAPRTMGQAASGFLMGGPIGAGINAGIPLAQRLLNDTRDGPLDADGNPTGDGRVIDAIITAAAADNGTNIISAPHILTMDNEQAEIRIGQNIPIITSRVDSAAGQVNNLASSVNVERQDIGVTLRVTPHITEGDSLRLEIYQEISAINAGLSLAVGNAEDVGVPLSQRTIENTVIVKDQDTVVIGGLLSDEYQDQISKVPFLGDIPILGWMFKSTNRELRKINLLIFLTPYIIRSPQDMELESIRKREEFANASQDGLEWSDRERQVEKNRQKEALAAGEPYEPKGQNPARIRVLEHEARYPVERIETLHEEKRAEIARIEAEQLAAERAPYFMVAALVSGGEEDAMDALQHVIDAGHDGTLVSTSLNGGMAFEVRVGPFPTIDEARRVKDLVARSRGVRGLSPTILVVPNPYDSGGAVP
jgi:type II secretory pathway component GspD/PulD (secretin)